MGSRTYTEIMREQQLRGEESEVSAMFFLYSVRHSLEFVASSMVIFHF